jgi:HPt (histidine-containing phosphotransfer) domain-containing protein
LDLQELLDRCLGNLEFAQRVLAKFEARFGDDLRQLERDQEAEAAEAIARVAHRLKGSAANVAAKDLERISARIEELGRLGRLSEIPERLEELRGEWSHFVGYSASVAPARPAEPADERRKRAGTN